MFVLTGAFCAHQKKGINKKAGSSCCPI